MIIYNNEHFTLTGKLHFWNDINTIFAYKQDLITFDEICVDIFMADGYYLKLVESTDGWEQFIYQLNNMLSISDNWYNVVAQPAFATNLTLIYDKENRPQEVCVSYYYA